MARLKIENVRKEIKEEGWDLLSPVYTNLRTEMEFRCPEGHIVTTSFEKWRRRQYCPICDANPLKDVETAPKRKEDGVRRVLSIDQSTSISGWAVFDDGDLVSYGTFEAGRFSDTEIHFRIRSVCEWLLGMIAKWDPDIIVFEDIQYQRNLPNGIIIFKILASLQGALVNVVAMQDIPFEIIHVGTWRKHCQIKGRNRAERKASAQRHIKESYDVMVSTDEADAICMGKHVAENNIFGQIEDEMIHWG